MWLRESLSHSTCYTNFNFPTKNVQAKHMSSCLRHQCQEIGSRRKIHGKGPEFRDSGTKTKISKALMYWMVLVNIEMRIRKTGAIFFYSHT